MRIYIGQKSVNNQKQTPELFLKKAFLEISQSSQENTCVRVSLLIKLQAPGHSDAGVFL